MHIVFEAHGHEYPANLVAAGVAVVDLLEHGDVVDEVEGTEALVKAGGLGQVSELTTDRQSFGRVGRVKAEDPDFTLVGTQHGAQQLEEGALSRAVRSKNTYDLPTPLPREIVEGPSRAETLSDYRQRDVVLHRILHAGATSRRR